MEHQGRVARSATNEGDAERLRVVEIAQRYDLDRVYNGEISGWQSHETPERSEHPSTQPSGD